MPTVEEAVAFIEKGDIEKGLSVLRLLRKNSDHEVLLEIAQLFFELGFVEEAIDVTEELLAFYPQLNELKLFAVELYVENEREEDALQLLSTITPQDENYLRALLLSADLYERQGLAEVAEQKLLEAKRKAPNEPVITFGLGEFYLHQGNFNRSSLYFEELLQQGHDNFNNISISLRLAESLTGSGKFEEALAFYEKGIRNNSEPDAWFGYALTANRIAEYQKTIRALNHLKDLDPQYTTLYPLLAQAYEKEGAFQEAMDVYVEGIRLDEFNEELYLQAGKLSFQLKDEDKGIEFLQYVLSIDPSNTEATSLLLEHYLKEERFEDVCEMVTEIERFGDLTPEANWKAAMAFRELEQDENALKRYETAYTELKDNAAFLEDYGRYMLEIGRQDQARALFGRALELDADRSYLEEELHRLSGH